MPHLAAVIAVFLIFLKKSESHVIDAREGSIRATTSKPGSELFARTQTNGCCGCGEFGSSADTQASISNYNYLSGHGGSCSTNDDGTPAAMICNGHAAVYIASPTNSFVTTECSLAGTYALSIIRSCTSGSPAKAQGQICDSDGFCIIVAGC